MPPDSVEEFLSAPGAGVVEALGRLEGPVLVLGAAGKMGLHLCMMIREADRLAGRAARVTAVSRFSSVHGLEAFSSRGIPTLRCDLEDEAALAGLPDVPNVVFMAGAKFGTSRQPDLLERMNVVVPELVAKRFTGSRFIVFSTGCVYPMVGPDTRGCRESVPADPPGAYARSCLGREQAFAAAARESGTRSVLVRLNYSTEFRYGVLVDIARKVLLEEPIDLAMGYVNLIWQRDAVDHILQAFPLASTGPRVLNVTGPDIYRVRELAERLGRIMSREPRFTGTEADTAWLNDASEAHRLFGPPPTGLDQMLEWTASWLLHGGETFNKPTGFQVRDGKF